MTLGQWARLLDRASVWLRHGQAAKRGRIVERLTNMLIGRLREKATRRLWR